MLYISMEDFWAQADAIKPLSREQEKDLAQRMAAGDETARDALVRGYLPFVAAKIRRAPSKIHTLRAVYECIATLEKCVNRFNFQQDSEPFIHHLSWALRQCITRCIADQG